MSNATRERIHQLVDCIPESELSTAERVLQHVYLKATMPLDDEPLSEEDLAAVQEARAAVAHGEIISHEEVRRQELDQS
jgi:hypothetical protein